MRMRRRGRPAALIAVVVAALGPLLGIPGVPGASEASAQPCQYEITALVQGPECGIFGFPPTFGTALSDNGEVVGWYTACTIGTDEAFYWSEATGFVTLDRPPGVFAAMASDISNEGTIVGTYQRDGVGFRGFVYDLKTGEWTELPPVNPSSGWSDAYGVSPDGQFVVGKRSVTDDTAPYNAFIWTGEFGFVDAGLIDGASTWALGVNNMGTVAGRTSSLAFRWPANGWLEFLPLPPDGITAGATDLSAQGTVVGGATTLPKGLDTPLGLPMLWPIDSQPIVLPLPPGHINGSAFAISDTDTIVGSVNIGLSDEQAILIGLDAAYELDQLLAQTFEGQLRRAVDVNTNGQILVRGYNADGNNVAILLMPIAKSKADLSGDCIVNSDDLQLLLDSWGECSGCSADLDGGGTVGPFDLAQLLSEWG